MKIAVSSELAGFADVWPTLDGQGAHHAYAFQTRDVLEVWLETIGVARATQPLLVRVSRSDGTPLMLLPLGLEQRHGMRIVRFLDGGVADYNAPVLFSGAEAIETAAMRQLWADILAKLPRFDVAILEKIPATIGEARNPFQVLAPAADRCSGHFVRLSGAGGGASGSSKALRFSGTSRKRRRLEAVAKTQLLIASAPAEVTRLFEAMVRQKTRRYIETRGFDGFEQPGYRTYYRKMTERLAASGNVQVCALLANDEPIAAHWGIVTRDRFYALMPAFEAGEWARYSPGLLHLEDMIQWSCEQGIATFDLGVGDEPYKLRIANGRLPLFRAQFAGTMAGRAYLSAMALRSLLSAGPIGEAWRAYKKKRVRQSGL